MIFSFVFASSAAAAACIKTSFCRNVSKTDRPPMSVSCSSSEPSCGGSFEVVAKTFVSSSVNVPNCSCMRRI